MVHRSNPKQDLGIIVLSCDKYSDLWEPFFDLFFLHWPDCPYDVYLASNKLKYNDPRVNSLLSGEDTDWSSGVRRCIQQIDHSYIMLFLDDAFLTSKINTAKIQKLAQMAINEKADYLRLRPCPEPDIPYNELIGIISKDSPYRTSIFASIWPKETFLDLLVNGESAWAFEIKGSMRSSKYDRFYSTWDDFFSYIHVVENGRYIRHSAKLLKTMGVRLNYNKIKLISWWDDYIVKNMISIGKLIITPFPVNIRNQIKEMAYTLFPQFDKFRKKI
jgi:hypothetical protein